MHDTSARLVEWVLPAASYRQWVLTVPFPLHLRIARDPGEPSRVLNLFHAFTHYICCAQNHWSAIRRRDTVGAARMTRGCPAISPR